MPQVSTTPGYVPPWRNHVSAGLRYVPQRFPHVSGCSGYVLARRTHVTGTSGYVTARLTHISGSFKPRDFFPRREADIVRWSGNFNAIGREYLLVE